MSFLTCVSNSSEVKFHFIRLRQIGRNHEEKIKEEKAKGHEPVSEKAKMKKEEKQKIQLDEI